MPALLVFLGQEGFRWWQHLDILKDNNKKKDPDEVFNAFTETLEVSTSHWNHIDKMYSDIRQGEHETTDQLDQCIKILVEKCGYMEAKEKKTCQKELLFHTTKHFEGQEVGQITDSKEGDSHLQQAATVCQRA